MVSSGGKGSFQQPSTPTPSGATTSYGSSTPFDPSAGFSSVLPSGGAFTPDMLEAAWARNAAPAAAAAGAAAAQPAASAAPPAPPMSPTAMFTQMLRSAYGPNGNIGSNDPRMAAAQPQDADSRALRNMLAITMGGGAGGNGFYSGGGGGGGGRAGSSGYGGSARGGAGGFGGSSARGGRAY